MLHDLSYLAGLVDGEGSVGWHSAGRGTKRFVIEIKMTSEGVIDWLAQTFGGYKQHRPSNHDGWQDQWRWRIQNGDALRLYDEIQPFLKIKGQVTGASAPCCFYMGEHSG